jgi:hypothetical protein
VNPRSKQCEETLNDTGNIDLLAVIMTRSFLQIICSSTLGLKTTRRAAILRIEQYPEFRHSVTTPVGGFDFLLAMKAASRFIKVSR